MRFSCIVHKRSLVLYLFLAAFLLLSVTPAGVSVDPQRYNGTGKEVMLQGFHWTSYNPANNGNKHWYRIIAENASVIKEAGFDYVWFPPLFSVPDSSFPARLRR